MNSTITHGNDSQAKASNYNAQKSHHLDTVHCISGKPGAMPRHEDIYTVHLRTLGKMHPKASFWQGNNWNYCVSVQVAKILLGHTPEAYLDKPIVWL